ncbi:hypothetical protein ANN_14567 [Periplaneta americana]|uniref:Mos1 transposase HTH domain-containing protein n=1 Tax=Periplaneta americana TaxID=6978 RepID=A0ABQ8SY43_PERAM|nr:hypothetical protein ANN_14567 [Periplaneta americana]
MHSLVESGTYVRSSKGKPIVWFAFGSDPSLVGTSKEVGIRCNVCKLVDNDGSFRQRAVFKFLIKEEKSAAEIHFRLQRAYGDVCMGASSVRRWVKHLEDGTRASKMNLVAVALELHPRNATRPDMNMSRTFQTEPRDPSNLHTPRWFLNQYHSDRVKYWQSTVDLTAKCHFGRPSSNLFPRISLKHRLLQIDEHRLVLYPTNWIRRSQYVYCEGGIRGMRSIRYLLLWKEVDHYRTRCLNPISY